MSDLTLETFALCKTAQQWEMKVEGSKGDEYTVRWDSHSHKRVGELQYDFSCTCQGYKYRGKCSHIEKVKSQHCGWHQFIDGGKPTEDNKCPHCGGEITWEQWGV